MQTINPSKFKSARLICENLAFAYGKRLIFQNLSFIVESGEIIHISGTNGAGKSTLLNVLAGLKQASKGSIRLEGEAKPFMRKSQIEYLPAEGNALYQTLDSQENLRFWYNLRTASNDDSEIQMAQALQHWGLDWKLSHLRLPVSKFSTGMRRRLALARLMLSPASIWLLDEPLYGLDRKGCQMLGDLLNAHSTRGGMTLIVTHETSHLESLLTRTLQL